MASPPREQLLPPHVPCDGVAETSVPPLIELVRLTFVALLVPLFLTVTTNVAF